MMKKCVRCEAILDDSDAFCTKCGASQGTERICPSCGLKVAASSNFCPNCGRSQSFVGSTPSVGTTTVPPQEPVREWLIFSIVTTVVFFPLGAGALVFAILARNEASKGTFVNAYKYAKIARWWNIVMWGFFVVGAAVGLFFSILGVLLGSAGTGLATGVGIGSVL